MSIYAQKIFVFRDIFFKNGPNVSRCFTTSFFKKEFKFIINFLFSQYFQNYNQNGQIWILIWSDFGQSTDPGNILCITSFFFLILIDFQENLFYKSRFEAFKNTNERRIKILISNAC